MQTEQPRQAAINVKTSIDTHVRTCIHKWTHAHPVKKGRRAEKKTLMLEQTYSTHESVDEIEKLVYLWCQIYLCIAHVSFHTMELMISVFGDNELVAKCECEIKLAGIPSIWMQWMLVVIFQPSLISTTHRISNPNRMFWQFWLIKYGTRHRIGQNDNDNDKKWNCFEENDRGGERKELHGVKFNWEILRILRISLN